MKAQHDGLEATIESMAWSRRGDGSMTLAFLSLVGPREAVRGILAALASHKEISVQTEGGWKRARRTWKEAHIGTEPLRGNIVHGAFWSEGVYVAREPDPRREALWLSRQLGKPVHPNWIPLLEEKVALESYRCRALTVLASYEYRDFLERLFQKGKAAL